MMMMIMMIVQIQYNMECKRATSLISNQFNLLWHFVTADFYLTNILAKILLLTRNCNRKIKKEEFKNQFESA